MGCCKDNNPVQIDDNSIKVLTNWDLHSNPMMIPVPIHIQHVHPLAKDLYKSRPSDIGWDVSCVDDEKWTICLIDKEKRPCFELMPYESHTFHTGIKVATPENYGFILEERSGLGIKDICRRAGIIEGSFRGEWRVHLMNLSKKPRKFYIGDRICQAVLTYIIPGEVSRVDELPESDRGEKGFASSGR